MVDIHIFNSADEISERSVDNPDAFSLLELRLDLRNSGPFSICCMITETSSSERAKGFAPPTKPVTRGVLLIRCQVSSSKSISTRIYPG